MSHRIVMLVTATFLAIVQANDMACVSTAFIRCSLVGPSPPQVPESTVEVSPKTKTLTYSSSNKLSTAKCPRAVYECLKKSESSCPMVKKFTANLQAVCEPARRKHISEFQMCAQQIENECGTSEDDPDNEMLDEYNEALDEVGLENLDRAKCDSIKKRHSCTHSILSRERCSPEVVSYFENMAIEDFKEANINLSKCLFNTSFMIHERVMSNLNVIGYNDDPNSAKTVSLANLQPINEVPNAMKRELKSTQPSEMDALSSVSVRSLLIQFSTFCWIASVRQLVF